MKKLIIAVVLSLLVAVLAIPAFAVTNSQSDDSWLQQKMNLFEQRMSAKNNYVDQMVKDGTITQEQGDAWKQHFDEMYKFHQQNGFLCPGGGAGQGYGFGRMGGNGQGFGMGRGGNGMGQGYFQQQVTPQNL